MGTLLSKCTIHFTNWMLTTDKPIDQEQKEPRRRRKTCMLKIDVKQHDVKSKGFYGTPYYNRGYDLSTKSNILVTSHLTKTEYNIR